jgi:hypothetical protein
LARRAGVWNAFDVAIHVATVTRSAWLVNFILQKETMASLEASSSTKHKQQASSKPFCVGETTNSSHLWSSSVVFRNGKVIDKKMGLTGIIGVDG